MVLAQNCLYSLAVYLSFQLLAQSWLQDFLSVSVPRQLLALALAQSLLQAWGHALGLLGEEAKLG